MQCQQANELFSDYTARALDSALTVSVDNHLAECTACREQAGALRRVWAQLDQMPFAEPPAGLRASILSALDDQFAQAERDAAQRRKERFQFQFQWDWRALFRPRTLAYATTLLVVILGSLEAVHSQRAAIDPLGALIHVLHPATPALAPLPSVRATRSLWTAGSDGGTLTVHLQAVSSGDIALSFLNYRAELVPGGRANEGHNASVIAVTQGHFDTTGAAVVTLPLAQEQQLRDADLVLQVTLSLSNAENALETQKVIIPLTLLHGLKEGAGR
jgi:hypothetical protein